MHAVLGKGKKKPFTLCLGIVYETVYYSKRDLLPEYLLLFGEVN